MADSARYVFRASIAAHTQFTRLFDFVEPTAIAMWNLRWQVKGFLSVVPDATSTDVSNRFSLGSGFRGGAIKRATSDLTWEHQQEQFANFVLINAIATFEDFVSEIEKISGISGSAKDLQFPSTPASIGRGKSYQLFGADISSLSSAFLHDAAVLRRYSANIDALLICYRFFKEVRNCIAHNGGKASLRAVSAYNAFSGVANAIALGVDEVPEHSPILNVGENIKISLRGVIGFSGIILKIITTYDIDFSKKNMASKEILERVKSRRMSWTISKDPDKRLKQISKRIRTPDMPKIVVSNSLVSLLIGCGAIPSHI